jgi:hypothetical protein
MDRSSAALAVWCVSLLAACADGSEEAPSASALATKYDGFSCQQIAAEKQRIAARTAELSSTQAQQQAADAAVTVATAVLLPIWFSPGEDPAIEEELGRLRAETSGLDLAAQQKNCGAAPRPAQPQAAAAKTK